MLAVDLQKTSGNAPVSDIRLQKRTNLDSGNLKKWGVFFLLLEIPIAEVGLNSAARSRYMLSKQLFEATLTFLVFLASSFVAYPQAFCLILQNIGCISKTRAIFQTERESLSFLSTKLCLFSQVEEPLASPHLISWTISHAHYQWIISQRNEIRMCDLDQLWFIWEGPYWTNQETVSWEEKAKWLGWIMGSIPISPHTPAISSVCQHHGK